MHPSRHFLYRINTNKICGHIYLPYNCGNTYGHLKILPPLFPLQLPFPPLFPASYFLFKTLYVTPGRSYPTKLSTWAKTTIQTELQSLQKMCGKVWSHITRPRVLTAFKFLLCEFFKQQEEKYFWEENKLLFWKVSYNDMHRHNKKL